ncbi:hypothetical protein [Mesorhizobium australicum]|uniref:DUF5983 domain-containing protein n=1 Tax=Mesorhizobium australicum TaxID=536018 RepID=A0A1X7MQ36_9HYPH|nr:hypothetical protein [Mesorhizobium australicum]SMH26461.1 hypothetical protein SAMN02982922_0260 [Mesorhizobium australicum]
MTTLETRRFVVISTAHVSEATAKRLDSIPPKHWPCLGGPYGEYGWFLYAHDENAGVGPDAIPDELFNVMIWARRQGFDCILFDCDADQVAELPTFDW